MPNAPKKAELNITLKQRFNYENFETDFLVSLTNIFINTTRSSRGNIANFL